MRHGASGVEAVIYTGKQKKVMEPTILKALGLDPHALQAVQIEKTQALPGFHPCSDD